MSKEHNLFIKIKGLVDGSVSSSFSKVQNSFKGTEKSILDLKASQDKIKNLDIQIKGFEKIQNQINITKARSEALNTQIEEFKKSLSGVEKGSDEYKALQKNIKNLSKDKVKLIGESQRLEAQSKITSSQLQKQGISTEKLDKEKIKLANSSKKLKGDIDKLTKSQKKNADETKKMTDFFKNAGLAMGGTAIAGGVAFAKMGMDFSASVAQVATVADSSQVSMNQMGADILKLSKDTGIAAGDLAKDVYDSISSGVKTSDSVKTVATNSKLAKAGFAESGQSLDLLTTIVNGYGKSMGEADKISDILINTQNKGKVTVAQLASSMGKIIPTANASNVSLEQIASGYAIMTSKGIASAESTTYMNSMLNELSKSGTGASNVLKKSTGKSFQDLMKDGKSLSDVLGILENSAKKDKKTLADMFGSAEAGKAALVLATNSGKDFNDMVKSMENSAGVTQEAFDKLNAEPLEKFKKSVNNLKVKGIEMGMAMMPLITNVMDGFLKFTQLPLVEWLTGTSTSVNIFKAVVIGLTIAVGGYVLGLQIVNGWTKLVAGAQFLWNAALTANPIGLIIAGLAGLIAGLVYAYNHSETFRMYVDAAWATIKEFGAEIAKFPGWIKQMWGNGIEKVQEFWGKIQELWFAINQNPFAKFALDILALANPITAIMRHFDKLKEGWEWVKGKIGLGDDKPSPTGKPKPTGGTPYPSYTGGYPVNVPKFATGGIIRKPTIAEVGEGGDEEVIIPMNNSSGAKSLLNYANSMIGNKKVVSTAKGQNTSGDTYIFQVTIPVASETIEKAKQVANATMDTLEQRIEKMKKNQRRLSLG